MAKKAAENCRNPTLPFFKYHHACFRRSKYTQQTYGKFYALFLGGLLWRIRSRSHILAPALEWCTPPTIFACADLFHNNCNNFSDEVSHFLLGTGIPAHITGLPAEVLSTPLGQSLKPMIEGMQASMCAEAGSNDPFTARAAAAPTPPAVSAIVCDGDVCTRMPAPTAADGARLLVEKLSEPLQNAYVADINPFVTRLIDASNKLAAVPSLAEHALTSEEVANLEAGAAILANYHAGDHECSAQRLPQTMDWLSWYALIARVHTNDAWPERAKISTLFLLRAAAARPCAAGFYTLLTSECPRAAEAAKSMGLSFTDGQGVLQGVLHNSLAKIPEPGAGGMSACAWMYAGTALAFAGNLLVHKVSRPTMLNPETMQTVVNAAVSVLLRQGPDGGEEALRTACPKRASTCSMVDCVLLTAAGVLHNYALALFPGALASDKLGDVTTTLLVRSFDAAVGQQSGRVATRVFSAISHLLSRQGTQAVELAVSLELSDILAGEVSRWAELFAAGATPGKKLSCHVRNAAALSAHAMSLLTV